MYYTIDVATRTVRLDEEAERTLREVRAATGMPISEALKRGLRSLRDRLEEQTTRTAFDVYERLDLGPGGYAVAPSTEVRRGIKDALRQKLQKQRR